MTSNEAGTPTDSPNPADDDDITAAAITGLDGDQREDPDTATYHDQGTSVPLVEQTTTAVRRLYHKIGVVIPKRRKRALGAFTATVTATTGLVAGWVIRRGRARKLGWPRRGQ